MSTQTKKAKKTAKKATAPKKATKKLSKNALNEKAMEAIINLLDEAQEIVQGIPNVHGMSTTFENEFFTIKITPNGKH